MMTLLHILLALVAAWLVSGTLLNLSKHPHWYIRGWDFPRVFVAILALAVGLSYALFFRRRWWDDLLLAGLVFVIVRQLYLIYPYTRLGRTTVKPAPGPAGDDSFRLLISNILMENHEHDLWLKVVREADPDVIVAVEVDGTWDAVLSSLAADYPHCLRQPQDNYYGMAVYSRLEFDDEPEVRFRVQNDVPSARVMLRL